MRALSRSTSLALAGAAALGLFLSACASSSHAIGSAAGDVVGGTAWVAMKGGGIVLKTTARTMKGAARGIHQEFSSPSQPAQAKTSQQKVAALSE